VIRIMNPNKGDLMIHPGVFGVRNRTTNVLISSRPDPSLAFEFVADTGKSLYANRGGARRLATRNWSNVYLHKNGERAVVFNFAQWLIHAEQTGIIR
jgi:hypothetical protein